MVDALIIFLSAHGTMLLSGVSALLLATTVVVMLCTRRNAVLRQRCCEVGVLAALAWLVLACLPLPRVGWGVSTSDRAEDKPMIAPAPQVTPALSAIEIPRELIAKPQPSGGGGVLPSQGDLFPPRSVEVTTARGGIDVRGLLVQVYLCGAVACAGWLVLGQVLLWRLIRRSTWAPEAALRMVNARTWAGCGWPRVRVAPGLSRPVTCGVWRPTILLPPALLEEGCARQLRQVLLHELGHVEQRDGWGNLLFCVALPVLYFHPLYWWLRREASLARELVADDWAARADGKAAYVTELVALARQRMAGMVGPIGAIGILQNRSHFYRRMRMLLQRHDQLATRCSRTCRATLVMASVIAVMGMAAVVGVRPARAQVIPPAVAPAGETGKADQTIGSQDSLQITTVDQVDGRVKSVAKMKVDERGNIQLPLIGSVKAVGLTKEELEKAIAESYRDKNLSGNSISVKFIEKGAAADNATELFTDAEIRKMDPVMKQKKAQRDALAARIIALRNEGAGDDRPELAKLRAELVAVERELREMRDIQAKEQDAARRPGGAADLAARKTVEESNPNQISMVDAWMKKLTAERDAIAARVEEMRAKGVGDTQPEMAKARDELALAEKKMEVYAREWRDLQFRLAQNQAQPRGAAVPIPLLPAPGAQPPQGAAIGGVQLDVVNLANTLVDAAGAVRLAKLKVSAATAGNQVDAVMAQSNLQTAVKRLELLKGIAAIALETAKADAKRAEELYKQGAESAQAVSEATSKMKMLELIVKGVD